MWQPAPMSMIGSLRRHYQYIELFISMQYAADILFVPALVAQAANCPAFTFSTN